MTDQVQNQDPINNTPSEQPIVPQNVIPVEETARSMGWVPKEHYEGDENKWLPADEFVRRQPLFEKIERQNKELKEIKRTVQQFAAHHSKVKETEFKRAIEYLKQKKVEAFEEGDAKAIVELDEKIAETKLAEKEHKAQVAAEAQQEAQAEIHPEFAAWQNRNTWYTSDRGMKAYADTVAHEYLAAQVSLGKRPEPAEVLKAVEKRVREEFAHKFKNANREKPGAVEGTSSRGKTESGYTPSDFEQRVAEKFVRQGLYKSKEDYYKELKLLNGKS